MLKHWKRYLITLTLITGLAVGPVAVGAQDSTPEPTPAPDEILPPPAAEDTVPDDLSDGETFLTGLINLIKEATFVEGLALAVVAVTALAKWLLSFTPLQLSGGLVWLAVQVLAWVGWVIADRMGLRLQFESGAQTLAAILTILLPIIGAATSHQVNEWVKRKDIPVISAYARAA